MMVSPVILTSEDLPIQRYEPMDKLGKWFIYRAESL